MPNILSVLHADGKTNLPIENRSGIREPIIVFDMEYVEGSVGRGVVQLVIRNETTNNKATSVQITTTQQPKHETQEIYLDQKWDYKPLGMEEWVGDWQTSITIPEIPPGRYILLRTKVETPVDDVDASSHRGSVRVNYLRSTV